MTKADKHKLRIAVRQRALGCKGLAVNASELFGEMFGFEPTREQAMIVVAQLRMLARGKRVIQGKTFYLL